MITIMWGRESFESNDELVDYLVEREYIKSREVENAFRSVDRVNFSKKAENAYKDTPLPLKQDSTISAPHMVAVNTELLDVNQEDVVLEVGSGSGYQLAILSKMAEKVYGIERLEELVNYSKRRLKDIENVEIVREDNLDVFEEGMFDKILFSCAIEDFSLAIPYLKENGIIVAPIKDNGVQRIKKYQNGDISSYGRVRFVDFVD